MKLYPTYPRHPEDYALQGVLLAAKALSDAEEEVDRALRYRRKAARELAEALRVWEAFE